LESGRWADETSCEFVVNGAFATREMGNGEVGSHLSTVASVCLSVREPLLLKNGVHFLIGHYKLRILVLKLILLFYSIKCLDLLLNRRKFDLRRWNGFEFKSFWHMPGILDKNFIENVRVL
jgi:hypothetical protein